MVVWDSVRSSAALSWYTTRQAMYVKRNIETRSCNHYCRWKAIDITYSDCICNLTYPARNAHGPYYHLRPVGSTVFFTLSPTYVIIYTKCVFIFSTALSETFLILRRTETDMIKNVHWSSSKVPLALIKLEFSRQLFEKLKYQTSWKSFQREKSCSVRTDGQTNMKKCRRTN